MNVSKENKAIPAVEGFFTWPSEKPQLMASKCKSCGRYFFPRRSKCSNPDCGEAVEDALLSTKGTLWSYTVQHYMPPLPFRAPDPPAPYGIGLVELPEGIRVVGMLTGVDTDNIVIGTPVELIAEKIYEDEAGNDVLTWKFRPIND